MMRHVVIRLTAIVVTTLATVSAAAVALGLARDVREGIEALAIANSDSAQWTMAQLDVEMLAFQLEIRSLQAGEGSTDQLRRRFDVLYGRIGLMGTSRLYAPLRGREDFDNGVAAARALLDWATPLIDGPDSALMAALPQMADLSDDLRPLLRNVTLSGQRAMAADSDMRRQEASATLSRVAVLTLVLFAVLAGLVLVLARLVGQARQRAAEQALTHGRLRAIVATSLDAILVTDARGRILDFNGAAEALFGTSRLMAMGQPVTGFIAVAVAGDQCPDGLPPAGSGLARVDGLRRDGSRFPAECSVGEAGSDGELIRVCFLRDISDRLSAEQALVEARDRALAGERSNAEMLALMSHEIRTPLNGILGTLDLLQDTRLTARQREYLRIVRNSGDLLLRHVNDVLDIARLDAGKMPVAAAPFDVAALLEDVAASQRPAAQRQGNRLLVAPGAPGPVLGDAQKLRQVLLNLTGNAVKFTRDGEITLAARRIEDGQIAVSVTDTGIGIAPADLERIFDDFVTLDSSYGRRTEGTGLGLPIARRMVRAMGGTIEVDSCEGAGSQFRILLPLPPASDPGPDLGPAATVAAPALAPPLPRKLDVLVVEDNAINRFVVRQLLADDGHRVDEAVNGAEGVRLATARCYDLILMDIGMPELDGVAATRAIRTGEGASRATPIIALTANALPEDLARFKAAGMVATLVKPLSRGTLRDVLAGVVPAPPDTCALPLVDAMQVGGLMDGLGRAAFDTLLGRFLDETGAGLEILARAGATEEAADLAHRLAGSAAVFGAARLRAQLIAVESAARDGRAAARAQAAAAALADWPETRRAFGAL